MKQCTKCNRDLPYVNFTKCKRTKDGLSHWCKECKTEWRKVNRERILEKTRLWREKNRDEINVKAREWESKSNCKYIRRTSNKISAIILSHPEHKCECVKCGENDIHIIDLHHIDPSTKEFDVETLSSLLWTKVIEEAKKCIPVCRNCHGKIHRNKERFDLLQEEIQKEVTRKLLEVNILRKN